MPITSQIEIGKLSLDLKNFRTTPQKNEADAVKAMVSIKGDRFFAIMESIVKNGFLFIENIIALKDGETIIVKEGNRRIAALKIIQGILKIDKFNVPDKLRDAIALVDETWLKDNLKVPCTIYNLNEADKVDKVVALAHGKGEKASRDPWNSVAKARHNRDAKQGAEPGLDILEKYLKHGKNLTGQQKERWAGDYPVTILDEALRKIAPRVGFQTTIELANKYPKIAKISELDDILLDIGLDKISYETIRSTQIDFPQSYGINPIISTQSNTATNQPGSTSQPASQTTSSTTTTSQASSSTQPKAYASNDPKYVASILRKFNPRGNNRQKVVVLLDELKRLKIKDNPFAFCFILRSMFEISAKAYCGDNGISTIDRNGRDKKLVDVLREVTNDLTNNNNNLPMVKVLHGAMTEISKPEGILSVTSMNQLVHNQNFSVQPSDICILFGNIYPLLEAMN